MEVDMGSINKKALFSERMGYEKLDEELLLRDMSDKLRNRIWNVFKSNLFNKTISLNKIRFCRELLDKFFGEDIDQYQEYLDSLRLTYIYPSIKEQFYKLPWHKIYEFIEHFTHHYPAIDNETLECVVNNINRVLIEERVPYRIVNGLVTPLVSDDEIVEVKKALNSPYKNVNVHLNKALTFLSDKKEPDYANSIKESVSAIESLIGELLGRKGTLGDLIDKLHIHPALKEGYKKLYGWTSDDGGIRHGKHGDTIDPDLPEARYMLINSSSFINYLIDKIGKKAK